MRRIRIHNDIHFVWSITQADGSAYILEGKDLRLWMRTAGLEFEITDFELDENRIIWDYFGKDQKKTGVFNAVLCENHGAEGMITLDAENIVQIVERSSDEGGAELPGLSATSVSIGTSIWGHDPDWPGEFSTPRLEIDTEGDNYMAYGETLKVHCHVFRGFIDVTNEVISWKAERESGDAAEDAAWALKTKVVNFDGNIELAFTPTENDLSIVQNHTKFIFTATLSDQTNAHYYLMI